MKKTDDPDVGVNSSRLIVEGVWGQNRLHLRMADDEEDPDNGRFAEIELDTSGDRLTFADVEDFLEEVRHEAAIYFDEQSGLDIQGEVMEWVAEPVAVPVEEDVI